VRRKFVAQSARLGRKRSLHLLPQDAQFGLQRVDLLLLLEDGAVQFFQQVFVEADVDFEVGDSRFDDIQPIQNVV
jgi:hypothetical protein